jgi:hypothetical protein
MAEMVGFSRGLRRPTSAIGGLLAALKGVWFGRLRAHRAPRLRMDEWPDYLLEDIGLDRRAGEPSDPRERPTGLLLR